MDQITEQWNKLPLAAKFLIVVLIWGAMAAGYYFMYYEDVELSLRALSQGYKIHYNG